jgi:hypothetical protein
MLRRKFRLFLSLRNVFYSQKFSREIETQDKLKRRSNYCVFFWQTIGHLIRFGRLSVLTTNEKGISYLIKINKYDLIILRGCLDFIPLPCCEDGELHGPYTKHGIQTKLPQLQITNLK